MLKSKIKVGCKPNSIYPYVSVYEKDNTVILFTSPSKGIILSSEDRYYVVGTEETNIAEDKFVPCKITLDSTS